MTEISIKIKGLKQTGSKAGKKKKGKKVMAKPKTKTESYLEKLKGREYSYNTSPFYDYKTGLQPTYIYRQQTIPQLQQDAKHTDLITLLEEFKKKDMREQTGKLKHDSPPPLPFWPGVNDRLVSEKTLKTYKPKVDEPDEEQNDAPPVPPFPQESKKEMQWPLITDVTTAEKSKELILTQELAKNKSTQLSNAKAGLKKALEREELENLGLQEIDPKAKSSSVYKTRIEQYTVEKEQLKTQIKNLKNELDI